MRDCQPRRRHSPGEKHAGVGLRLVPLPTTTFYQRGYYASCPFQWRRRFKLGKCLHAFSRNHTTHPLKPVQVYSFLLCVEFSGYAACMDMLYLPAWHWLFRWGLPWRSSLRMCLRAARAQRTFRHGQGVRACARFPAAPLCALCACTAAGMWTVSAALRWMGRMIPGQPFTFSSKRRRRAPACAWNEPG